jgi:inositol hexakisphosphate
MAMRAAFAIVLFAQALYGQDCPVAVGPGCDQVWLFENGLATGKSVPGPLVHFRKLRRITGSSSAGESGSAQPSANGYVEVLEWIRANEPNVTTVMVFDLRQESHGFMDGTPVSWYFGRDQINCGKSEQGMTQDEVRRLQRLRTLPSVQLYTLTTDPTDTTCKAGTSSYPKTARKVLTEAQIVDTLNGRSPVRWMYTRLHVADFHAPPDTVVDQFVAAVQSIRGVSWMHFHCAAGDGRTTTFMAMADIMRNGAVDSLDTILGRQCDLGNGAVNLCSYCGPQQWKNEWARDRYWFLQLFYLYCNEQRPGYSRKFGDWKTANWQRVPRPPECPAQPACAGKKCPGTASLEDGE